MPKTKKSTVKVPKPAKKQKLKLSPAERSQIAKNRWAKIRAAKTAQEPIQVGRVSETQKINEIMEAAKERTQTTPAPPIVEQDNEIDAFVQKTAEAIESARSKMTDDEREVADRKASSILNGVAPVPPPVEPPVPQLAPVKAPKPKRYTGPKEFSVALKAAENRLAKAIVERAQAAGQLAALNAEIPSLLGIINALKGSGTTFNPAPAPNFIANDFQGNYFPNALSGGPNPAPVDPMDAIRAAMAAPPVSRAIGNAVQLPPDVVGTLEGPDDDEDKYITGPAASERGWIGG